MDENISLHFNILNKDDQHTPIVMLHGWMQQSKALEPLAKLLSKDRPVVLIDLPGFGKSPAPDVPQGTEWYKNQVIKLLNYLSIKKFHIFGHSFGGRIAVRIAAQCPDEVDCVILNAAHGLVKQRKFREKIYFKLIGILRWLYKKLDVFFPSLKVYERYFIPRFASRDYKQAGILRNILVKTVNEDLSEIASSISRPSLLLWGTEDCETPISMGEHYAKLIKHSNLIKLTGHGHMPYEDAGSHLLFIYISRFLADQKSV